MSSDEDEWANDIERHRPLLNMGVRMDVKGHSVAAFMGRVAEIERGVLLIDKINTDSTTARTTTTRHTRHTHHTKTKDRATPTKQTPTEQHTIHASHAVDVKDDHSFELFLQKSQLESRYNIDDDDVLIDTSVTNFGSNVTCSISVQDDDKLILQHETFDPKLSWYTFNKMQKK